ncbi:TadE/TadG family type IV pilus assembly protein [Roseobacter sp. GAI101]|uniref:TadE/TadG family type IV pilus assembly protein n=1 Tax=Roseobacter sp. (strain GAI101) TaxID=391589 RepID=UPI00032265D0|nr:TadE/TadG family type IV pilus assembly protein [Roseobacter sp. GAI101]
MITRCLEALRRFRKAEDGSVFLIEFVIILPIIFTVFMMSVDMSMASLRQVHLDRGLEQAVRFIRLNTSTPMTHDQIKNMVCDRAGNPGDCAATLRLEMVNVNPRQFSQMNPTIDCVDKSLPIEPERGFALGKQHDLMLLRACLKFDSITTFLPLGFNFIKDGNGQGSVYAISAFVQEPS